MVMLTGMINLGVTGYFALWAWEQIKAMPELPVREVASAHEPAAGEHGAPADAHGAPASDHGAPAAGGHGAAPAADHGGGGHGAAAAAPAVAIDPRLRSWVTLEEMFVNVQNPDESAHTLAFKLEVELFDESARHLMEERQAVVKNAVLEIGREQEFDSLRTLAGKLYFKEALVSRINQTVKFPLIRDIHLASFALR